VATTSSISSSADDAAKAESDNALLAAFIIAARHFDLTRKAAREIRIQSTDLDYQLDRLESSLNVLRRQVYDKIREDG
jgi:hypothetical protein